MNILVTGGAGFIGSHLVDRYISAGHHVIAIDNLSNGKREFVNKKAIFYTVDITDSEQLEKIFSKEKIDIVNHHAAQIDVQKSIEHPAFDKKVNVDGTLNLLKAAATFGIIKFIFASSAAVYGNQSKNANETAPCSPLSPYGRSKLTAEALIRAHAQSTPLQYTILRYPNVYGPRHDAGEGGVIQVFFKKMLSNEQATIFGTGNQTRDFIFVADVAHANELALTKGSGLKLNISTGQSTTINDVFSKLQQITGYKQPPAYEKERTGDIMHSSLNNSQARLHLGWAPETDLNNGLLLTLNTLKHEKATLNCH